MRRPPTNIEEQTSVVVVTARTVGPRSGKEAVVMLPAVSRRTDNAGQPWTGDEGDGEEGGG